MTPALQLTITQEKRIYRNAVQASLEAFYGKSKPEAAKLVRAWWSRLATTKAFHSAVFLHAEPVNTAASIAGVRVVAIDMENRKQYHRILDASRDLVLSKKLPSSSVNSIKDEKPVQKREVVYS